jgi:hypothetical protein
MSEDATITRFGSVHMFASGTLTASGVVRDALQELRDSSLEDLKHLLVEYYQAKKSGDSGDIDALATEVENTAKLPKVARLLRTVATWSALAILSTLIGVPVDHEANQLLGWSPPSITAIRQMSPAQLDKLSGQIVHQLEQADEQLEKKRPESGTAPRDECR